MIAYETKLDQDLRWALQEGSMHFEEASAVHRTLRRIVKRLDELGLSYAVAGGMVLFLHGFRRFTEDVDILVTKEGLRLIHERLEGLGYVALFPGSKNLRDAESGVRIEFLTAGDYPGDGKPKPVAFPDPAAAGVERDGVRYLSLPRACGQSGAGRGATRIPARACDECRLAVPSGQPLVSLRVAPRMSTRPRLIELKLASGLTNPLRLKDIADVQELIHLLKLPAGFADQLDPFVRSKFLELWTLIQQNPDVPE